MYEEKEKIGRKWLTIIEQAEDEKWKKQNFYFILILASIWGALSLLICWVMSLSPLFLIIAIIAVLGQWYALSSGYSSWVKEISLDKDGFFAKRGSGKEFFVRWGDIEYIHEFSEYIKDFGGKQLISHWAAHPKNIVVRFFSRIIPMEGNREDILLPRSMVLDIEAKWLDYFEKGGEFYGKKDLQTIIAKQKIMILLGLIITPITIAVLFLLFSGGDMFAPMGHISLRERFTLIGAGILIALPAILLLIGAIGVSINRRRLERVITLEKNISIVSKGDALQRLERLRKFTLYGTPIFIILALLMTLIVPYDLMIYATCGIFLLSILCFEMWVMRYTSQIKEEIISGKLTKEEQYQLLNKLQRYFMIISMVCFSLMFLFMIFALLP